LDVSGIDVFYIILNTSSFLHLFLLIPL
jgi:hypothetical protein